MVAMKKYSLCMTDVLKEYDMIREGQVCGDSFWDVVVLTTSDAAQQQVYELEIANKLALKQLPECAKYHVVHDPPGLKIGSGGSTMYTLSKLTELEPEWRSQKILLMHAGGSSQRLPSASVLGKAFIAIPIGNRLYTMFDVKLALCMPFAKRLPPGVFICCPDTFETFNFGNGSDWKFGNGNSFLALAHPSPVQIGKGHGVYILASRDNRLDTEVLTCSKVLQKPTERMMKEEGAILDPSEVADNIRCDAAGCRDWVFTDSNYFFDHTVSDKLLGFYKANAPLAGELCAYGDFLQPLGTHADGSYVKNCKNIMDVTSGVVSLRRNMFELLKHSPLSVMALKQSKFYHIGTMTEYIDNFCFNTQLQDELGLSKFCYSACVGTPERRTPSYGSSGSACIIHSLVTSNCSFADSSIVEFCSFTASAGVVVQSNCVISNCEYNMGSVFEPLVVPANTFMQTVPVLDADGRPMYVTLMFSIHDDMKSKVSSASEICNLSYFGRGLLTVVDMLYDDWQPSDLFGEGDAFSLWNAKLLPLSHSPHASFTSALATLKRFMDPPRKRTKYGPSVSAATLSSSTALNADGLPNFANGLPAFNGTSAHASTGPAMNSSTTFAMNGSAPAMNGSTPTTNRHSYASNVTGTSSLNGASNGTNGAMSNGVSHSGAAAGCIPSIPDTLSANGHSASSDKLFSFADVIKCKDVIRMINGRNELSMAIQRVLASDQI